MAKPTTPTQKMLFWWGLVLLAWSAYRFYFTTQLGIFFDEFIAKPLVFLIPVFIYIKRVEKKNFIEGVSLKSNALGQDIFLGMCTGIALLALVYFSAPPNIIATNLGKILKTQNIFLVLLTAFATSFAEEVLSRGFVLKRLYQESQNMLTSSFFASILYFFLRVPILFSNEKLMGAALLGVMMTDVLFSLAISLVFLTRKNLILPILIHFFYIIMIYLYIGFS